MSPSICFVNDFFIADEGVVTTGPMVQIYLLGRELSRRGWEVHHVVSTGNEKAGSIEEHQGVTVHYLPHHRYGVLVGFRRLVRKMKEIKADYYYQRGRSPLTGIVAYAAGSMGKEFIWSSAGARGVARRKYIREQLVKKSFIRKVILYPYFRLQDMIYEYGIRAADFALAQTEQQQKLLHEEFGRGSAVLGSGHHVPATSISDKPEPPMVLWCGAVKPSKQPEIFIELSNRLAGENARFVMLGRLLDRSYEEAIHRQQNFQEGFSYEGEVPFEETSEWFSRAWVLVNTTVKDLEGLPNTFIQAWQNGVPVVSLHADPDDMIKKKRIGYQECDIDVLTERVRTLVRDRELRRDMGWRARDSSTEVYGIESVVDRFIGIIGSPGEG
jgi:glycosyltransferase involved in cell wall biosynthesis